MSGLPRRTKQTVANPLQEWSFLNVSESEEEAPDEDDWKPETKPPKAKKPAKPRKETQKKTVAKPKKTAAPKPRKMSSSHSPPGDSRSPPFTEAENQALARKVLENYNKVFGHLAAKTSTFEKRELWKSIARYVSATGKHRRTSEKCKKRFTDLKIKVKNKMTRELQLQEQADHTQAVKITYSASESIMKKIIDYAVIHGVHNLADTDADSRKSNEHVETHELVEPPLPSSGIPNVFQNADGPTRPQSPLHVSLDVSSFGEVEERSPGTSDSMREPHQEQIEEADYLPNVRTLMKQNQEFNTELLENVGVCNSTLGNLTHVVTDLRDEMQTTNHFLARISQNLANINETLRSKSYESIYRHPMQVPPSAEKAGPLHPAHAGIKPNRNPVHGNSMK